MYVYIAFLKISWFSQFWDSKCEKRKGLKRKSVDKHNSGIFAFERKLTNYFQLNMLYLLVAQDLPTKESWNPESKF